jgi:hypothetical protein
MTFPAGDKETKLRPPRAAAVALMAVALLLSANSCRLFPTSPAHDPTVGGASGSGLEPAERVPVITHLRGEVRGGTLYLAGNLAADGGRQELNYSPYVPGGWCLQVLLNTDQQRTGYWRGYEYIVRGVEWDRVSRVAVVRRITLEEGYPGGWGPSSGEATLRVSRGSLAIVVPLDAIGGDDGNLDFVLETYATVRCPECAGGYSHRYGADYFGAVTADGRAGPASGPVVLSERPGPWGVRPHTGSAAPRR